MSFSIPSTVAIDVVKQLKKHGVVRRGWLGVAIQDVDKALAESLELDKPQGALINAVEVDSPADRGGIKPGDVIVKFDGHAIIDADDLPHIVGMISPDSKVKAEVVRQGKVKVLKITVGALDGEETEITAENSSKSDRLGLLVQSLDEAELRALNLRGGVAVNEVKLDSAAANAGIKAGDIIVQLGYSRIDTLEQYTQVIAELPTNTPILVRFYRQGWAVSKTIVIE